MKIALDAMGGDFAPEVNIEGARLALKEWPDDASLILIGDEQKLQPLLKNHQLNTGNIDILHTPEAIEMGEHPVKALTKKPNSSIALGFRHLKRRDFDAFCSTGNTGAMHVGAMLSVKSIEGIIRPGIAGFVPKESGGFGVIIDIGANADCKPDVLQQFGLLGSIYANHIFNIPNPKVGLLNLGEEEQKGSLDAQAAFQLLKFNDKINFIGNIEGRDLFNDKADVIVCDGFTGNVILKLVESFYDLIQSRGINEPFLNRFNYETIGGSPILGINGNVVIGHGSSSPRAVNGMLLQTYNIAKASIYLKIKESMDED